MSYNRLLRWCLSSLLLIQAGVAFAQGNPVLTPERIFSSPDLSGPAARGVDISPDGKWVTFLQPKESDRNLLDLWIAPASSTGAARMLVDSSAIGASDKDLTEAELARRERQRVFDRGVVDYKWDQEGKKLLVPVAGEIWIVDLANSALIKRIGRSAEAGDATDARFSPKGRYISFVRHNTLFVAPVAGGRERPLSPQAAGAIGYGVAEFVAQEEFARDTGYWWSPNEQAVAYTRVDETKVALVTTPRIGASETHFVPQRFPRAGQPNALVELFIRRLGSHEPVKVDLGADPDIYLGRVDWSAAGSKLYVQRQSRDQKRVDLLEVDPDTGRSRVILTERRTPWVNLNLDFTPLEDGGFLWVSERTGFKHLYLYDDKAQIVRAVTSGAFPLAGFDRERSLHGVDQKRGVAYVLASKDGALERHLYAVDYRRGGPMIRVTRGEGWWSTQVARTARAFVGTFSSPSTPPQTALYGMDGRRIRWLVENRLDENHPYAPYLSGLPKPEFGQLAAEDGQKMDYVLLKPAGFDPGRRYPAIVQVYGGPGRQKVMKNWRAPEERLFLDRGYIVFQLDNRGAANRGLAFEAPIAGRLGTPEVSDQIAGRKFLQSLPFVDGNKIGVSGWSYGGFLTLRLMTEPGSGFAAGAAGAAPAEWPLYDTHYTERFLGQPAETNSAYRSASILPRLQNLHGELLLIHGMADDNVLFENSTRMMAELQSRRKEFDLMLYPGEKHSLVDPSFRIHLWRTYLRFFERSLKGPVPVSMGRR